MSDDKPASKPAKQTAKIIAFKPPESEYELTCPQCERTVWQIRLTDLTPNNESVVEFICAVCGWDTKGKIHMGSEHYEA